MLGEMAKLRGRQGPLRTRISLATEMVSRSDITLIGTYRDGGQKMVDGMISVDLMTLANDAECSLVLVSDDDDFVPSMIGIGETRNSRNPLFVLRRQKKLGVAPNDKYMSSCNVVIAEY